MAMNASFFVSTLPDSYDAWNVSAKLNYLQENLYGFASLSLETQNGIAAGFSAQDIRGTWQLLSGADLVNGIFALSHNATSIFLYYISNPSEIFALMTTEPPTTMDPQTIRCLDPEKRERDVVRFMILPAIVWILVLAFLGVRKHLCKKCCWGRPACVYPVNFIDEHSRRWAYASAFVLLSYKALNLFEGQQFWEIDVGNCNFCSTFVNILNVLGMCAVYYPLLACISLRKNPIANLIGLLYLVPWMYFSVGHQLDCPIWANYRTENAVERAQEITAILQVCFDIPVLIAYIVLVLTYAYDFGVNIYTLYIKNKKVEKYQEHIDRKRLKVTEEVKYVLALFNRKVILPETFKDKIIDIFSYKTVEGFRYSPRVVCTLIVSFMVLFKMSAGIAGIVDYWYTVGRDALDFLEEADEDTSTNGTSVDWDYMQELLSVARWSIHTANIISGVFHVLTMIHISIMYRKNLRKYFRGRRTWHFKNAPAPANIMVASMKYSGYQVAFLAYGYLLLLLLLTLFCIAVAYLTILPWMNGDKGLLITWLIPAAPAIAIGIGIYLIQLALAKFVFLQNCGEYLALNNRNAFHVATFIFFFLNIIIGIFGALKRILFSVVFGSMLIARLDRCLLMRGFEKFDTGFKAYLGMLTVDYTHNHPIMKAFVQLLWDLHAKSKQEIGNLSTVSAVNTGFVSEEKEIPTDKGAPLVVRRHPKWRNKWWKAITLHNNPSLYLDLMKEELKKGKKNRGDTIDIATDVVAIGGGITGFSSQL